MTLKKEEKKEKKKSQVICSWLRHTKTCAHLVPWAKQFTVDLIKTQDMSFELGHAEYP